MCVSGLGLVEGGRVKSDSKVCWVRLKVREVRAREWCLLSWDPAEL